MIRSGRRPRRTLAVAAGFAGAGLLLTPAHAIGNATRASTAPEPARPVVVAVVDTGISADVLGASLRSQWRCAKVCRPGSAPVEPHGTEVAATILDSAPRTLIDSYDVTDEFGAISPPAVTAAIKHAAARGTSVINVSLVVNGKQPAMQRVLARLGTSVVVAAAGNDGRRLTASAPLQPCMSDSTNVVCVTGSTPSSGFAGYNYSRRWVDLAAPSVAPIPQLFKGTSAAAALVSGAMAQLLAEEPCLRPAAARRLLRASVAKHPSLRPRVASGGALDLPAALQAAASAC